MSKPKMIVQTFKTRCEDCGEELTSQIGDMTGNNEIIIDFLDDMEFYCDTCDVTTHLEIQKHRGH